MKKIIIVVLLLMVSFKGLFAESHLNFPYYELSISDLEERLQSKQITCVELIEAYLDRIKAYDLASKQKPPFNAIQAINLEALKRAESLDHYFKQHGNLQGALHCVPIVINDNIAKENLAMSVGSLALFGNQSYRDAAVVKSVQNAGAVIIASGAIDEFAEGALGISSRHGRTGNAYDPMMPAGGASSGSAVAVSLNFAMLAIASDQIAAARIPAAMNGIYSLRVTDNHIPIRGVFPSFNQDKGVAPMARSVTDLAKLLSVLNPRLDHVNALHAGSLQGMRIGIVQSINDLDLYEGYPQKTIHAHQGFIKRLRGLGAKTILKIKLNDLKPIAFEKKHNLSNEIDEYFQRFPSVQHNFKDLCESSRTQIFKRQGGCSEYLTLVEETNSFEHNRQIILKKMKEKKLDALLYPMITHDKIDLAFDKFNQVKLASSTGLPALTFLTGYEEESLPVSMEMLGKPNAERKLLGMAFDYELHFNPRKIPVLNIDPMSQVNSNMQFNFIKDALGSFVYYHFLEMNPPEKLTASEFKKLFRRFKKEHKKHYSAELVLPKFN